jgi:hypothetical protein
VVAELGGAKLNMQGDFWCSFKVIDHSGRNINTPEILKGLFAKRAISFGVHNYTRQDSCGEQWRDFYTTTHSSIYIVFRGDLGFSIEAYHSAKLNDWLKKLLVPANYMQAHLKRNKYNLICLRAMDFIFDHFREKKLARKYISSHLKEHLVELEKSGLFNVERGLFPESLLEAKTVDELAKIICDYDYLKHQKRGETFDLITSKQLMAHLVEHLFSMNPIEARNFLITYFEKSSFVAAFLPHERSDMLQNLQNMYVLLYSNCPYVSEKMFNNYAPILTKMLDLVEFKIDKSREDWEWCHIILFHLHSWNVIETADDEITDALLQSILKQLFDKTVARLAKCAPDPSVRSTRSALIFSAMAVGVISATPYIVEYTQEAYRHYTSQHP